ncbi:hypothetical protein JOD54_001933 [Actinokineospora baliensis]|uniref:hypothetical protein n=1 Tax=Actinokineospora baliensis TaxID=547056 RepID=UPI0019570173|nr:hypothetical protein [Actinokineospora baliensis]MBM7771729.1 hypothetical protein [Actinokineospora baliensis]
MSAFYGFELDRDGVAEILRGPELAAAVHELADQVATAARAQGHTVTSGEPLPVEVVDDPAPDRAGTTVAVRHPAGVGMEAHHGVLTRAAVAAGLDVEGLET